MTLRQPLEPLIGPILCVLVAGATMHDVGAVLRRPVQAPASSTQSTTVTDAQLVEAFAAIAEANTYRALSDAIDRHAAAIGSARMVALADERERNPSLEAGERVLIGLVRQLSLETRGQGPGPAARLLAVRLIASYALAANTPQDLAAVLENFGPFRTEISPTLVREAMKAPENLWPPPLIPLMEQLARDWPAKGPLAAATAMSESAAGAGGPGKQGPNPNPAAPLVGHWRSTTIVFEQPRDENLVLAANGTAETWTVVATGRSEVKSGRWSQSGTALDIAWQDGSTWSQPFTFFEGQLVLPNIRDRRRFWERIR